MLTLIKSLLQKHSLQLFSLNILHIFNDGYGASFLLLLPFIAKDLQLNLTQVGFLGTLFYSLSILLALPSGYIASKFGGMRALVAALFVYGLGFLVTGFAPNYFWLFITFMIVGSGVAIFHPISFALIAKWTPKETRGKRLGDFTALGDVGKIAIATLVTVIVAAIGWQQTAILYAVIAIGLSIILYFFYLSKSETITTESNKISGLRHRELFKYKKFLFATSTTFFDTFASSSLFIFLPFLLLQRGVDPALLGAFTGAFFVGNFAGKTVIGRLVDKFGTVKVLVCSEILMALFILLLANSSAFSIIIICAVILGVFTKGTIPVLKTMLSESADHHGDYQKTYAADSLVDGISKTLAPVILGFVSDKLGIISAFNMMAIMALLAILPAIAFQKSKTYKQ